jgi:hypothetical protein
MKNSTAFHIFAFWIWVTFFVVLLGLCSACGRMTPRHHISYSGSDPQTEVPDARAAEIDAAAEVAAAAAGVSPEIFAEKGTIVYLHRGPIEVWGEKLYGDAQETAVQSQLLPCLLEEDSALAHELLHVLFWVQTGGYDPGHTSPRWHEVERRRAEAAVETCR